MAMITVNGLTKTFRQYKRFPGLFGAFRSLVTREYAERDAVRDMTFRIDEGEAIGYLGPNGAGKSTMIKMMTGILVPTSGEVLVFGRTPHKARKENARQIGVVFGQRSQLWWDLPVADSFDLHRHIYKLPPDTFARSRDFCVELLGIAPFLTQPVRQLSLGQRMRVEVAMALLHEPKLLFLDEPTIGLDVTAKDQIRQFLRTVNRERKTSIVLTTHDLKDIEELCPRLLVVNEGSLVYDGSVETLRQRLGTERRMTVDFRVDPGRVEVPGAELVRDEGARKTFRFERGEASAFELMSRIAALHPVEDVSLEDMDIEDVIRALYKRLGNGGEAGAR